MSPKKTTYCPKKEDFIRAFLGETGDYSRQEFLDHVRRCPCCRPKMQVLAKVQAELEARADTVPESGLTGEEMRELRRVAGERLRLMRPRARFISFRPLPVAAVTVAAVIALALGYLYLSNTLLSRLAVRGSVSQELRLLGPGAHLREAPADFSWSDIPGRDEFRFVLIDESLNTICEIDTHSTGLRLPEEERQKLVAGKSYLWTVLALDNNDGELASASREFEIE
jgi:hypothetical protein